jgi:hypothetical protein
VAFKVATHSDCLELVSLTALNNGRVHWAEAEAIISVAVARYDWKLCIDEGASHYTNVDSLIFAFRR